MVVIFCLKISKLKALELSLFMVLDTFFWSDPNPPTLAHSAYSYGPEALKSSISGPNWTYKDLQGPEIGPGSDQTRSKWSLLMYINDIGPHPTSAQLSGSTEAE